MAKLIIGPKMFGALMREIYGFKDLKINRLIEKTLRGKSNLVIALRPKDCDALTAGIHTAEIAAGRATPFTDEHINSKAVGMPAIQYTLEEWKELVTVLTEKQSSIEPRRAYGISNVHLDITQWRGVLAPMIKGLLAQGSRTNA